MPPKSVSSKAPAKAQPKRAMGKGKPAAKPAAAKPAAAKPAAAAAEPAAAAPEPEPEILKIPLKQINTVLNDDDGKIAASLKWPLVMDANGRVGVFLRHRDVNMLQAMSPTEMLPEKIRMAILGSLRFGKPIVFDLGDVATVELIAERCNFLEKDLFDSIMNRTIMKEEYYKKLVKDEDPQEYRDFHMYNETRFQMILLTENPTPPKDILLKSYPVLIES